MVKIRKTEILKADLPDTIEKGIEKHNYNKGEHSAKIEHLDCGHVNNLAKNGTRDKDGFVVERYTGICPKGCK